MDAVVCQHKQLRVAQRPSPTPGRGQLLLEVVRCGICGSDLHARQHSDEVADVVALTGYPDFMRSEEEVVLGHELLGRVAGHGKGTRKEHEEGTRVVSLPLLRREDGLHTTGLSRHAPGGYAEQLLVEESLSFAVPDDVPDDIAVLTEPLAVGYHAVRRSEIAAKDVAIVIGCGPVGLAVILMLKARGVKHVIASDLSAGRRALATRCGADVVVDPAQESPYASAREHGHLTTAPIAFELAVGMIERLRKLHLPWWHVWNAAEKVGAADPKRPVVFECVGVPGMIDGVLAGAPLFSRVVVVGVCMGTDQIRPTLAINKELDLRFVLGYTPPEFRDTLGMLAAGKLDPSPLVTGVVGLDGVDGAFTALADPERHAKVLVDPSRTGASLD